MKTKIAVLAIFCSFSIWAVAQTTGGGMTGGSSARNGGVTSNPGNVGNAAGNPPLNAGGSPPLNAGGNPPLNPGGSVPNSGFNNNTGNGGLPNGDVPNGNGGIPNNGNGFTNNGNFNSGSVTNN